MIIIIINVHFIIKSDSSHQHNIITEKDREREREGG